MAEDELISYFGSIATDDYNILQGAGWSAETNVYQVPSVSFDNTSLTSSLNDSWYYSQFAHTGGTAYSGFSFFSYVSGITAYYPNPTPTPQVSSSPTPTPSSVNRIFYQVTVIHIINSWCNKYVYVCCFRVCKCLLT